MGVCLRRLEDKTNLGEPILLLESTDMFMEECVGVLHVALKMVRFEILELIKLYWNLAVHIRNKI